MQGKSTKSIRRKEMNTESLDRIADLDQIGMMQMHRCKELDKEIENAKSETEIAKLKNEKATMLRRLNDTLAQMEVAFEALGTHV